MFPDYNKGFFDGIGKFLIVILLGIIAVVTRWLFGYIGSLVAIAIGFLGAWRLKDDWSVFSFALAWWSIASFFVFPLKFKGILLA